MVLVVLVSVDISAAGPRSQPLESVGGIRREVREMTKLKVTHDLARAKIDRDDAGLGRVRRNQVARARVGLEVLPAFLGRCRLGRTLP